MATTMVAFYVEGWARYVHLRVCEAHDETLHQTKAQSERTSLEQCAQEPQRIHSVLGLSPNSNFLYPSHS